MGISIACHVIGPRQEFVDHTGDWARSREVGDAGGLLVRPDQHVCWRSEGITADPKAELARVLAAILAR